MFLSLKKTYFITRNFESYKNPVSINAKISLLTSLYSRQNRSTNLEDLRYKNGTWETGIVCSLPRK